MNKKVSTLLTCGLMLGGSLLCSSAFAENLEGVVGNGKYYKILRSAQHNGSWADTPVESNNRDIDMNVNFLIRRCRFVGHFACKCMKKRTNNTLLSVYKTVYKCSQSSQNGLHRHASISQKIHNFASGSAASRS